MRQLHSLGLQAADMPKDGTCDAPPAAPSGYGRPLRLPVPARPAQRCGSDSRRKHGLVGRSEIVQVLIEDGADIRKLTDMDELDAPGAIHHDSSGDLVHSKFLWPAVPDGNP